LRILRIPLTQRRLHLLLRRWVVAMRILITWRIIASVVRVGSSLITIPLTIALIIIRVIS